MQTIKRHLGTSKVVFMASCLLGLIQGAYVYAAPVPDLSTCPAIKNDTQRLACYDQLAGTIKPAPPLGEPVAAVQPASTNLAKTSLLSRRWELDDADKHGTYQFRPHNQAV